jgi:hypothetical protein
MNAVHMHRVYSNLIVPNTPVPSIQIFNQKFVCIYYLSHTFCIFRTLHLPFHKPNNTVKPLITDTAGEFKFCPLYEVYVSWSSSSIYGGDSGNRIFVLYWRCSLIRVSVIRGSSVFGTNNKSEAHYEISFGLLLLPPPQVKIVSNAFLKHINLISFP